MNDEMDIDKTLEERAAQTNLSVQNVKSIIHVCQIYIHYMYIN